MLHLPRLPPPSTQQRCRFDICLVIIRTSDSASDSDADSDAVCGVSIRTDIQNERFNAIRCGTRFKFATIIHYIRKKHGSTTLDHNKTNPVNVNMRTCVKQRSCQPEENLKLFKIPLNINIKDISRPAEYTYSCTVGTLLGKN